MSRVFLIALASAMLGVALHVIMILILPLLEPDTIWQQVSELGDSNSFHRVSDLPLRDPLIAEAVCWLEIGEEPVSIDADPPADYWALSVFDRSASLVFTMSDTSSPNGEPDVLIVPPSVGSEIQGDSSALVLPAEPGFYFVTLKTFAPDEFTRAEAKAVFEAASCSAIERPPVYEPSLRPGETPFPRPKPPSPNS